MSNKRTPIPEKAYVEALYRNRHRCCICREPRKHVQIHHIDGNPSNHDLNNLAVLSLDCHSLVTGDEGLGRKYSPAEVMRYKSSWEILCQAWLEGNSNAHNEIDGPTQYEAGLNADATQEESLDSDYVEDSLPVGEHFEFRYELDEGDGLMLWVKNDQPVHVSVMRRRNYKKWIKEKLDFSDASERYWEDSEELKEMFIVDDEDKYSVVIANFRSDDAQVQGDISAWEFK